MSRILIVEDEVLIRLVLAEVLESAGFEVVEAGSGDEAAEILEQGELTIDLVLTDIRMPGKMDGFQLALWMRDKYPKIPVFLASGNTGKAETTSQLAPGYPFFPKPYNVDNVVSLIRDALK
ncbi:MAG: response regulator [Alphaproteobacteria bacterium]|nr:response regulator [Alphaproteobacteria bacterium]